MITRFRADPSKIRIGIRYLTDKGQWLVRISSKVPSVRGLVVYSGGDVREILEFALSEAERLRLPGMNLSLEMAYDHPQRV